jgi:hypothetical protein
MLVARDDDRVAAGGVADPAPPAIGQFPRNGLVG